MTYDGSVSFVFFYVNVMLVTLCICHGDPVRLHQCACGGCEQTAWMWSLC